MRNTAGCCDCPILSCRVAQSLGQRTPLRLAAVSWDMRYLRQMERDADAPLSPVGSVLESFRSVKKFFATRAAILRGETIFDLDPSTLAAKGYAGAWNFQKYEASIVSVPGLIVAALIEVFTHEMPEPPIAKWFGRFFTASVVILTPWLSYVYAGWLGRASLLDKDRTVERVERARRAYVYLSNSYLFRPELLMALTFAVQDVFERLLHRPLNLPASIPFIWYSVRQRSLRDDMFVVNGYSPGSISSNPIPSLNLSVESLGYSEDPEALTILRRRWRLLTWFAIPLTYLSGLLIAGVVCFIAALVVAALSR